MSVFFKRRSRSQRFGIGIGIVVVVLLSFKSVWDHPFWLRSELQRSQTQWTNQHITHYRFVLNLNCFCPPPLTEAVLIEVRAQQIVAVTSATSGEIFDPQLFDRYAPVERIFTIVARSLDDDAGRVAVTFDAQFGYPTAINIAGKRNVSDSAWALSIKQFERLAD